MPGCPGTYPAPSRQPTNPSTNPVALRCHRAADGGTVCSLRACVLQCTAVHCTWIGCPSCSQATWGCAGHDTETSTGLGTHKSSRACYEPSHRPHLFCICLSRICHLCLRCTLHPLTLHALTGASPRVTDLTESTTLPACPPACPPDIDKLAPQPLIQGIDPKDACASSDPPISHVPSPSCLVGGVRSNRLSDREATTNAALLCHHPSKLSSSSALLRGCDDSPLIHELLRQGNPGCAP